MLQFLQNNLGTIVVAAVLIALITLVIVKFVKDKKAGKSSCGGCAGCPNAGHCHRNDACGRYGKQDTK